MVTSLARLCRTDHFLCDIIFLPICERRHMEVLLKRILKMWLTGKAKKAADFAQRLIGVFQQWLGSPETAVHHIRADAHAKLIPKFFEQIGPAFSRKRYHICGTNRLIDIFFHSFFISRNIEIVPSFVCVYYTQSSFWLQPYGNEKWFCGNKTNFIPTKPLFIPHIHENRTPNTT